MNGSWRKVTFFFFFFSFSFSSARVLRRAALSIVGCCNVVQHYQCQGQLYIAAGVPVPIGNWVGCLTGSRDKRSEPSPNDSDSIVLLSRMKTWLENWFYKALSFLNWIIAKIKCCRCVDSEIEIKTCWIQQLKFITHQPPHSKALLFANLPLLWLVAGQQWQTVCLLIAPWFLKIKVLKNHCLLQSLENF